MSAARLLANQIVEQCGVVPTNCNIKEYRIIHLTVDCFKDMLDKMLQQGSALQKGGSHHLDKDDLIVKNIVRYCMAYGIEIITADTLIPGTILGLGTWTETPIGKVYNAKEISVLNNALHKST